MTKRPVLKFHSSRNQVVQKKSSSIGEIEELYVLHPNLSTKTKEKEANESAITTPFILGVSL